MNNSNQKFNMIDTNNLNKINAGKILTMIIVITLPVSKSTNKPNSHI